ncbi:hypothetical protein [Solicola sp. PLA-1-18]|uniref:hypothetical protein n=1 Tax=Solicola sp. PLA-1-18 TaxID=3380532 RepID=UPI003B7BB1F1
MLSGPESRPVRAVPDVPHLRLVPPVPETVERPVDDVTVLRRAVDERPPRELVAFLVARRVIAGGLRLGERPRT